MSFLIKNTTKGKLPRLPFAKIAETVLGKEYEASLVVISSRKSRELNYTYRGKDYPTNILSFPLDENEGEIFLDLKKARADAPLFERSYTNFIGFLFIHALLHLKGYDHGPKMETQERKICKIFKI
jgi:probable rRNA maturation factor